MKRLARIPTVFALVAMVAACTDMTAPEVTPPQFHFAHDPVLGQCPPGWGVHHFPRGTQAPVDRNGDLIICFHTRGQGEFIQIDNFVPNDVEFPF